jgi:hypothetical protein
MVGTKSKATHKVANPIETASNPDSGHALNNSSSFIGALKNQLLDGTPDTFISQILGTNPARPDSAHVPIPKPSVSKNEQHKPVENDKANDNFIAQLLAMDSGKNHADNFSESKQTIKKSGQMKAGETIDFRQFHVQAEYDEMSYFESIKPDKKSEKLAGIDYTSEILYGSKNLNKREAVELDQRIQDIMDELKRLVKSSSILNSDFLNLSAEQKPLNPGKYDLNFFEWLLIEIKKIRMKVEDAGAWLTVMKSKKSQRKYGSMAKKHGTSFTLSNERTTATQTG